jgi:hypothetical protein
MAFLSASHVRIPILNLYRMKKIKIYKSNLAELVPATDVTAVLLL